MNAQAGKYLLTAALVLCTASVGLAQVADSKESESLAKRRGEFQRQQLGTEPPGGWIIRSKQPPKIVWRNPERVASLGVREPLKVRWFDGQLNEHPAPNKPGRWAAWVEGVAANGLPLRRSLTFFVPPKNADFGAYAPRVSIDFPNAPDTPAGRLMREHRAEIDSAAKAALFRGLMDDPRLAIIWAGLAETAPRGRPARFLESASVRDQDYHLALKLKLLGLKDKVRPLKPPRKLAKPSSVLRVGSPEQAGMRPAAKDAIDRVCQDWFDDTQEPFAVLVARRGVIVTHRAFGRDSEGNALDVNYRCWVGSITKTVTSLLFARFVDQKLIGLDEKLDRVFPGYPSDSAHVPTFRQCLTHTSGLVGHGETGGYTNTHLENVVLNGIDVNRPGARYAYSGQGFEVAVKAMEIVGGKSGARLFHEGLFEPLEFGDVEIGNASADGHFTAHELAKLAQMVANRGGYGELELMSPKTFESILPRPLQVDDPKEKREWGVGLYWTRRVKPGAPMNSQREEDQIFGPRTLGHGSFSGCIFNVDLDSKVVVALVRQRQGARWGTWSSKLFQTVADQIVE